MKLKKKSGKKNGRRSQPKCATMNKPFVNPIFKHKSHDGAVTKKEILSEDVTKESGKISPVMSNISDSESSKVRNCKATMNPSDLEAQSTGSSTICLSPLFSEKGLKSPNETGKRFKAMSSPVVSYTQKLKPRSKLRSCSSKASTTAVRDSFYKENFERPSCSEDVSSQVVTKASETESVNGNVRKSKKFAKCGSKVSTTSGSLPPPESVSNVVTSDYSSACSDYFAGRTSCLASMIAPWDRLSFSDFTASSLFRTRWLRRKSKTNSIAKVNPEKLKTLAKRCVNNDDDNLHKDPTFTCSAAADRSMNTLTSVQNCFELGMKEDSLTPESSYMINSPLVIPDDSTACYKTTPGNSNTEWTIINLLDEDGGQEETANMNGMQNSPSEHKDEVHCQVKKTSRIKIIKNLLKRFLKRFNCVCRVR